MTVKTLSGTAEISSKTAQADIQAHRVLILHISVFADLTFSLGEPGIPADADGNPLYYDFDGDNDIDDDDIEWIRRIWNKCEGDPEYERAWDIDEDGCISILDIMPVVNSKYVP